jgi:hypothetical protein
MKIGISNYEPWPELLATEYKPSAHLLFMGVQIIGKLMLTQPFMPHWANLAMPLTSRGFTTGMVPYKQATFSIDFDCIDHVMIFTGSWGETATLQLTGMSVADLYQQIMHKLTAIGVTLTINQKPQETANTVLFSQDKEPRVYEAKIVNAWWRILVSTTNVLQQFHARFYGITPQVGLCWGTLDLRDARYKGIFLAPDKNFDFIARNAMDDEQFEVGFSANNEKYPIPSFFAFSYPKPEGFELAKLPGSAKWVPAINEFVLDYEDLRKSSKPEEDLLAFFEACYQAFATRAKWDPKLNVSGQPK